MAKKMLAGLVVALAIIVLVCAFGGQAASRFAPTPTPTPGSAMTKAEQTVTAKGIIVPARYMRLSFPAGGTLARLLVREGDKVTAGQPLARLDTADLELAVRAAEARLAQVKAGARPEDIAAAQAAYQEALAQYDKLKASPSQEEIAIAKANLDKAIAVLADAQAEYDKVRHQPWIGVLPQSKNLHQATLDYNIAKARYDQTLPSAYG